MSILDELNAMEARINELTVRLERAERALDAKQPLGMCSSCGARALARLPVEPGSTRFVGLGGADHIQWCLVCTYWQAAEPIDRTPARDDNAN